MSEKIKSPLIRCKFFLPDDDKYDWYADSGWDEYMTNESKHQKENEGEVSNFNSFDEYISERSGSIDYWTWNNEKMPKCHQSSPVWEFVVSLDEEDTKKYDLYKDRKFVAKNLFNNVCNAKKWNSKNFVYDAAIHTNTKHHHIHLRMYQHDKVKNNLVYWNEKTDEITNTKKLMINQRAMNKTKFALLNKFNNLDKSLTQIYQSSNELVRQFKNEFENKSSKFNEILLQEIPKLANKIYQIKGDEGRLQYNNLKSKEIKNSIDDLSIKLINSSELLKQSYQDVNQSANEAYDELSNKYQKDLNIKDINQINKMIDISRQNWETELKANLGNQILNFIKEYNVKKSGCIYKQKHYKEYSSHRWMRDMKIFFKQSEREFSFAISKSIYSAKILCKQIERDISLKFENQKENTYQYQR